MPIPVRSLLILMILSGLPALAHAQSSTLTGASRSMNPAISVNGLFRGQASRDNPTGDLNGFKLDGVEVQLTSVVDPFWKPPVTPRHEPASYSTILMPGSLRPPRSNSSDVASELWLAGKMRFVTSSSTT